MEQNDGAIKLSRLQAQIRARKGLIACGDEYSMALNSRGEVVYAGSNRQGQRDIYAWSDMIAVTGGAACTLAVFSDGTVRAAGEDPLRRAAGIGHGDRRISEGYFDTMACVQYAACGPRHLAVRLGNGRMMAFGDNRFGACDVSRWTDVSDFVCGRSFTAGLTGNGTILLAGGTRSMRHKVRRFTNIAGIFTDYEGETLYAVTETGQICSTGSLPFAVRRWKNVVFLAANRDEIYGITATGQLLTTDRNLPDAWKDLVFVTCTAGPAHMLAVTKKGQSLAYGRNTFGQCRVQAWEPLFQDFREFSAERQAAALEREEDERHYQEKLSHAERFHRYLSCSQRLTACISAEERVLISAHFPEVRKWTQVSAVSCGNAHVLALHTDGTVSADGNNVEYCCEVGQWRRIKAILAGKYHSVGLGEDGRVYYAGGDEALRKTLSAWEHVDRIVGTDEYLVGLCFDGSLVTAGKTPFNPQVLHLEEWKQPVEILATATHLVALFADGRVRTAGAETWHNRNEKAVSTADISPADEGCPDGNVCDTSQWRGVRAIAAQDGFVLGLCYGGHVLATGCNAYGQCDTSAWRRVVEIACGRTFSVGLCADGRVFAAGCQRMERNPTGGSNAEFTERETSRQTVYVPCAVDRWTHIMALCCGTDHVIGVDRSGQVLASGLDSDGQCSAVTHFTLFRDQRQLYGYGRYRQAVNQRSYADGQTGGTADEAGTEVREGRVLMPFSAIGGHLRADSERVAASLCGSDAHLTVLNDRGEAQTYLYEKDTILTERPAEVPFARAAAGPDSTLFLFADGSVRERCEFTADAPLVTLPDRIGNSPLYRIRAVAFGEHHRVVLLEDGTVRSFGENDSGQGDTSSWTGIRSVACGSRHTVGLCADGTVVAVGARRRSAPTGRGRRTSPVMRGNPCDVRLWTHIRSVVCARYVTLGLTESGHVRACGNNLYGQCDTSMWSDVVAVATSGHHSVGLRADGRVYACGANDHQECEVGGWRRIVQICVMPELTLGLCADGTVVSTGRCRAMLENMGAVRAMACFGSLRQVFVMMDGTLRLHIRGSEYLPEEPKGLRLFTPSVEKPLLRRLMPESPVWDAAQAVKESFALGLRHQVQLNPDGSVTAEGDNGYNQTAVEDWNDIVRVAAGPHHTAAIRADGHVVITGWDRAGCCHAENLNQELPFVKRGELSPDEAHLVLTPAEEPGDRDAYAWISVACGYAHTAALRSDGRVYAIGENADGRCDTRQWKQVSAIACGVRHTAALLRNGDCVAVGDNAYGQCNLALWHHMRMIACGEFHTVGVSEDGTVWASGDNRSGQCRVDDLRDVVSVTCLPDATLCVHTDGHVTIRGGSGEKDKAVSALRNVVAMFGCEHRMYALTVDRRLITL